MTNQINLEHICADLSSTDPKKIIKKLWNLDLDPHSGDYMGDIFATLWNKEKYKAKKLLTENTRIKLWPLTQLGENLCEIFSDISKTGIYKLAYIDQMQDLLVNYRRDTSNFAPLQNSTRMLMVDDTPFYSCVANEKTEIYAVSAGETEKILVHFDQWLVNPMHKQLLAEKYIEKLDKLLQEDNYGIIRVEKEFGPKGPMELWDIIEENVPIKFSCIYDQALKKIKQVDGDKNGIKKFIVLYDLIKSGHGLREIDEFLRQPEFGGQDTVNVILYDYSNGESLKDLNIDTIFDSDNTLFLRDNFYEEISSLDPIFPALLENDVFENAKLESVDTLGHYWPDFDLDIYKYDNSIKEKFVGMWIATTHEKVLIARSSMNNLISDVEREYPNQRFHIHYVPPKEN